MTGQIAGPSIFSLELVGLVIGVSMIVGAVDLMRHPGWAWKRAGESKAAYLILVLLLPLVGLGMYLFSARPRVAAIAAAGRAASLPFERFGDDVEKKQREEREEARRPGPTAVPTGFGSFGAVTGGGEPVLVPAGGPTVPTETSATFFSTGGTATRTLRPPMGLARAYRPRQRSSLPQTDATPATVPAGWKADPTGRHQFRYWDGFHWTENVSDAGEQSRDAVAS